MKIAYIILAHTDPEHIARLAKKITVNTPHEAFIHIDKKAELKPFADLIEDTRQIHFVSDRVKVYWGGFSSVIATIHSFRQAMQAGVFDRFIILQGLDYPIRSNAEITEFFIKNEAVEYIRAVNETRADQLKDKHKYIYYYFLDDGQILHRKLVNKVNSLMLRHNVCIPFKRRYIAVGKEKYNIYRGWAHFAITIPAVKYILDFYDNNPKFNRYFSTVYASDESYFHTILFNSPFINNTPEGKPTDNRSIEALLNVTYFEYPKSVTVFKHKSEYQKLHDSACLFFRKANSESKELLDYIDQIHRGVNHAH